MQVSVEIEDLRATIDALQKAKSPTVQFTADREQMAYNAICAMQQGIDQALETLFRICKEANRGS